MKKYNEESKFKFVTIIYINYNKTNFGDKL